MLINLFISHINTMSLKRSYTNPLDLILAGLPPVDQLSQHWSLTQCTCIHVRSDPLCPLYKILKHVKHQRSFSTFLNFTRQCPDIKRVVASKQTRANYLKYKSKCRSGRFYRKMSNMTPTAIRKTPQLYEEPFDHAHGVMNLHDYKEDDGGSATEEIEDDDGSATEEIEDEDPPEEPEPKNRKPLPRRCKTRSQRKKDIAPY